MFQHRRRTYGYFAPDWWENKNDSQRCDEIGINPSHFGGSVFEVLQTLAHEMVHLWQHHFGQPGRRSYHNREWGKKMRSIGLIPSHTGKPGGRQTGYQMLDFIEEGGSFERACQKLLDKGFEVTWRSCVERFASPGTGFGDTAMPDAPKPETNSGKRTKFTCSKCSLNAWAQRSAKLICGVCALPLCAPGENLGCTSTPLPKPQRKGDRDVK